MASVEKPLRPGEVERHYPVAEVARLLGMSRDWVYERINDGTFTIANVGAGKSKRRIPASSLLAETILARASGAVRHPMAYVTRAIEDDPGGIIDLVGKGGTA